MTQKRHFTNLHDYHQFLGLPAPEHPLISVSTLHSDSRDTTLACAADDLQISTDFYTISLKHILAGEIHYGRTTYDFNAGSLICMSPRQSIKLSGVRAKTKAKLVMIHEDFLRGTSIQQGMESASYFSYAIHEALHLSPSEESLLRGIIDTLALEYEQNRDAFSKEIMISQLKTLLIYAERFYQRQFQQRMESATSSLQQRFLAELKNTSSEQIPCVENIASGLHMTARYLSDALKVETGKTALENIHEYQIDRAKNLLLGTDDSVATIAYALGFDYPQYFSRLFKNKVGLTPSQYRNN